MRTYLQVSGLIFGLITVLHLGRLLIDLPVQAGGTLIPSWPSWVAVLGFGTLAVWALRLLRGTRTPS
jgi:hypothetical protein